MITARVINKLHILCPHCEKEEFSIWHLEKGTQFGPWLCDNCGKAFVGTRTESGADLELIKEYKIPTIVTLKYIHDPRLILRVHGNNYSEYDGTMKENYNDYFYNEHTCPVNYLRDVCEIIFASNDSDEADDEDPHGIFEFVSVEENMPCDHRRRK